MFVCSGGQGSDEPISESACMKRYLLLKGIREQLILEENRSTDTRENMQFSRERIMEVNPDGKIAFSTTNYHVFRSGIWARRAKMRALGVGAKTKWYFWPNAWVREFIGLMTEHRGKQILVLGGMILFYIIVVLLYYFVFAV
ncbi:MAG: YdcF family protein, partial [Solobacterium sp.]|nr:YdcF family protein [Solobacterium sp.]